MDNNLKALMDNREGYILQNNKTGVKVKATRKFVSFWEARGFEVVDKGVIRLIEEGE